MTKANTPKNQNADIPQKTIKGYQEALLANGWQDIEATATKILDNDLSLSELKDNNSSLGNELFLQVKDKVQKGHDIDEVFNTLAFLLGYNHKRDAKGQPDHNGKQYKTAQGGWPRGSMTTYKSQIRAVEKRGGGVAKFATFTDARKAVNDTTKKEASPLELAIKNLIETAKSFDIAPEQVAKSIDALTASLAPKTVKSNAKQKVA